MAKYELVECCPVPTKMVPVVKACLKESGAVLQSCYRAADAAALLHKCGKQSQAELYNGWVAHRAGYNPANPPGRSTHELRSDGVAYRVPAGSRLPYWCVGLDVDDGHVRAFCDAARKHGWIATVTYPSSPSEYHHINFRKRPIFSLPALKLGSKGRRVKWVVWALSYVHSPKTKVPYLPARYRGHAILGRTIEDAIKAFQTDHHQKADGVVGSHTLSQLKVCVRWREKNMKK